MDYKLYKEEDFRVSNWTGGKTKQLAIFPADSSYLDRNFLWRLSSATCEKEESDFSKLPDYDRVLMVLEGNVVLAHQDVRAARLGELEQDRFDGAYRTKSFGRITDYNLMVAKGNQGFLDVINAEEENRPLTAEHGEFASGYGNWTIGLFCKEGYAAVNLCGETLMMMPGQQLVVNGTEDEKAEISVMGDGILVRAQIFYNYHPEELGPTVIPAEKVSFDDYRACTYLVNSQFRGAGFIFRNKKFEWLDEELSHAVRKMERLYLPFFVTLLGVLCIAFWGLNDFSPLQWVLAIGGWLLADFFVISPLMYLAVVPKPVRPHIKDIRSLTPYEQGVYEREVGTNERLERILKKYKHTAREIYDEDGNRLDKTFK